MGRDFFSSESGGNRFFESLSFVGLVLLVSQLVDALIDPFIGYLIPRLKVSRRKVLFFSAFPFMGTFVWAFFPPDPFPTLANQLVLLSSMILFRIFYSVFQITYLSMVPELARNEEERRSVSSWVGSGILIGAGIIMVSGGVLVQWVGHQKMVLIVGLIALFFLLIPHFSVFKIPRTEVALGKQKSGIIKAYWETLNIPGFFRSIVAIIAGNVAYTSISISAPFITKAVLQETNLWTSYLLGSAFLTALVTFPFVSGLIQKMGLRRTVLVSLYGLVIGLCGISLGCFLGDHFLQKTILIFFFSLSGVFVAFNLTLVNVLISRFSDSAPSTMLYAVYGACLRLEAGLTTLGVTVLLESLGSAPDQAMGVQLTPGFAGVVILAMILAIVHKINLKRV